MSTKGAQTEHPTVLACFFVSGNVAALTSSVSRMMEKPYEYGTCSVSNPLSRTCRCSHRAASGDIGESRCRAGSRCEQWQPPCNGKRILLRRQGPRQVAPLLECHQTCARPSPGSSLVNNTAQVQTRKPTIMGEVEHEP